MENQVILYKYCDENGVILYSVNKPSFTEPLAEKTVTLPEGVSCCNQGGVLVLVGSPDAWFYSGDLYESEESLYCLNLPSDPIKICPIF